MNEARVEGKVIGIEYLTQTRAEVKITLLAGEVPISVIVNDQQTIKRIESMKLGSIITVHGKLGGDSKIHVHDLGDTV